MRMRRSSHDAAETHSPQAADPDRPMKGLVRLQGLASLRDLDCPAASESPRCFPSIIHVTAPRLRCDPPRDLRGTDRRVGLALVEQSQNRFLPPNGLLVPLAVRRIADQTAVEVGRAVAPPHRTSFAQRQLRSMDIAASRTLGFLVLATQCSADRAPCIHQRSGQRGTLFGAQSRIGRPPEPSADYQISSVRGRDGVHEDPYGKSHTFRMSGPGGPG